MKFQGFLGNSGHDPRVLGWSLASALGSLFSGEPASPSSATPPCLSLPLSLSLSNKIFFFLT